MSVLKSGIYRVSSVVWLAKSRKKLVTVIVELSSLRKNMLKLMPELHGYTPIHNSGIRWWKSAKIFVTVWLRYPRYWMKTSEKFKNDHSWKRVDALCRKNKGPLELFLTVPKIDWSWWQLPGVVTLGIISEYQKSGGGHRYRYLYYLISRRNFCIIWRAGSRYRGLKEGFWLVPLQLSRVSFQCSESCLEVTLTTTVALFGVCLLTYYLQDNEVEVSVTVVSIPVQFLLIFVALVAQISTFKVSKESIILCGSIILLLPVNVWLYVCM